MAQRMNHTARIYKGFREDMERMLEVRIKKNLISRKEANMPKITELITRTQGYRECLRELESKPEKRR